MIKPGALVINQWLLRLPKDLRSNGYRFNRHSRIYPAGLNSRVHRTLAAAGWQFFRMQPLVHERAIAMQQEEALCSALAKALRRVQNENLNALEIVAVKVRELFGWHLVSLATQPRQVQVSSRYDYGGCGQVFWPLVS